MYLGSHPAREREVNEEIIEGRKGGKESELER